MPSNGRCKETGYRGSDQEWERQGDEILQDTVTASHRKVNFILSRGDHVPSDDGHLQFEQNQYLSVGHAGWERSPKQLARH